MTTPPFGRIVPIHVAMLKLVGYQTVNGWMRSETDESSRKCAMCDGLSSLRRQTGSDFGYDAVAWREFLVDNGDEFGYTHAFAFSGVDQAVREALNDPDVIATLSELATS